MIGQGGFGKVYKLSAQLAVKEEYKVFRWELHSIYHISMHLLQRPLAFLNLTVFKRILELDNTINDHVIPLLEYIVGMCIVLCALISKFNFKLCWYRRTQP